MQIRTRLTLQFIFVVSLIILVSFGVIYYSSDLYRRNELYKRLENKAETSSDIFVSVKQIDSAMMRILDQTQRDKLPFESISIFDRNNRPVYVSTDTVPFEVDTLLLKEVRKYGRVEFRKAGFEVLGITFQDARNQFVVFASARDVFGYSKISNLRNTLLTLMLIIISIVAGTGWIYSGRALRPLSRVINEVDRMRVDRLDERLNKSQYNDEIGRLISTFNTLLDRLENAFKLQKLFLTGASHELRNPLTAITSQLQVALLKERSTEEYRKLMASLYEDMKQLNRTTADLLEFARLSYESQLNLTDVRIDDVLWDCDDYFRKTHPSYHLDLRFAHLPDDPNLLVVKGNEGLLRIACINLIDNACKFSSDRRCSITLAATDRSIRVSFSDNGIGMAEEQMKLIFEPFFRANSTAETRGHGIGLALTKRILELHGGTIEVESVPGEGTTFTFTLFHAA